MPGIMSEEGDLLLTNLRPRSTLSGASNPTNPGSRQSLLSAMNNFVAAVDEMDGAVMIPCKLQDMQLNPMETAATTIPTTTVQNGYSPPGSPQPQQNGNGALVPIPENKVIFTEEAKQLDLYTYYGMLRAIKDELVLGPSVDGVEEEEEDGNKIAEDDIAKQTATMFRHHLRGLFGVLRQMTTTADTLTRRYQTEIGDTSLSSTRSLAHYTL